MLNRRIRRTDKVFRLGGEEFLALRPGEDWTEWMKRGDENLYRAKSAGRDRVAA